MSRIAIRRPTSRQYANVASFSVSINHTNQTHIPTNKLKNKQQKHVEEVLVRDLEALVDPVHLPDRALALLAVVARLDDRREDQVGVVVALLRGGVELARRGDLDGAAVQYQKAIDSGYPLAVAEAGDRKSTRLNSSHSSPSRMPSSA